MAEFPLSINSMLKQSVQSQRKWLSLINIKDVFSFSNFKFKDASTWIGSKTEKHTITGLVIRFVKHKIELYSTTSVSVMTEKVITCLEKNML